MTKVNFHQKAIILNNNGKILVLLASYKGKNGICLEEQ